MDFYIGVKVIEAVPMDENAYMNHSDKPDVTNPREGYLVVYENGYESWSPKDVFEKAYLKLGSEPSKIEQSVVDAFMGDVEINTLDEKTTHVKTTALSGFVSHEVSSCVDPKNYDEEIGAAIALKKIEDVMWKCLGFVLQWGRFGLKR